MNQYTSLETAIRDTFGSTRTIKEKQYVSGGDINEAYALTLDDGTVLFMKANTVSALPNFKAEAAGLEAIRATGAIGVPEVLGTGTEVGNQAGSSFSFLLLEYISPGKQRKDFWEVFASELAAMHASDVGKQYGFSEDNWIGARKQINKKKDSWIAFFRDCRLKPQFDAAKRYFSLSDLKKIERLLSHLDRYLSEPDRPSLVHGDLWAGNRITGKDGKGWLIDPAVYYGHPEVDLAMTELFGGFPSRFYEAYKEAGDLKPGYEDRRDLYNLYQLLNHLNMFGSGYLGSVQRIVNRYTVS